MQTDCLETPLPMYCEYCHQETHSRHLDGRKNCIYEIRGNMKSRYKQQRQGALGQNPQNLEKIAGNKHVRPGDSSIEKR